MIKYLYNNQYLNHHKKLFLNMILKKVFDFFQNKTN
jgi:hypothetical protein